MLSYEELPVFAKTHTTRGRQRALAVNSGKCLFSKFGLPLSVSAFSTSLWADPPTSRALQIVSFQPELKICDLNPSGEQKVGLLVCLMKKQKYSKMCEHSQKISLYN